MKIFKYIGVRLFLALLIGGLIQEIIHITTGDPNRAIDRGSSILYGLILYFAITYFYKRYEKSNQMK